MRPTLKPSYPLTHIDTFAGESVIPRGLSILHIDRDEDRGRYAEPNVWIRHL